MELREWLIILGLALVSLIVIDGVRRLQRQRRVPRLDQAEKDLPANQLDESDAAKEAEINWELPNGGARVVKPADYSGLGNKPKLERQDHPGPSRVLSEFKRSASAKVAKRRAEKAERVEAQSKRQTVSAKVEPTAFKQSPSVGSTQHAPINASVAGLAQERHEPSVHEPSIHEASTHQPSIRNSSVDDIRETQIADVNVSSSPKPSAPTVVPSAPAVTADDTDENEEERHIAETAQIETAQTESVVETTPADETTQTTSLKMAATSALSDLDSADSSYFDSTSPALSTSDLDSAIPRDAVTADSGQVVPETASEEVFKKEPTLEVSAPAVMAANEQDADSVPPTLHQQEPVLRAEPEDAVFAMHAPSDHASSKRRQLRSDTVGEHGALDDEAVDEYRLVDFEGMARSFKRKLIERRQEKQRKKAEKALRNKALAKQKAERKALEAEQRREAKEAADAERARLAQEQAQAREAAANAAAAERLAAQQRAEEHKALQFERDQHVSYSANSNADYDHDDDSYYAHDGYAHDEHAHEAAANRSYDGVEEERLIDRVRVHPTLEKALRHDVVGEHAKETLSSAEEVIVISILSRDPEGFDGSKLLELMMMCGLRFSSEMGIFHRFETESEDSELQFSMVNVVKPGTFPIQEMGEFMTPGITLLMPLPGAIDSSAAFEAMVETAMVVVRHMGGELKDEHRSVMTAQTIEFARQRVREFERRHRLHRQMRAR